MRSRHSQGCTCVQYFDAIELRSGIEQQHRNALTRQVPRRHAARGAAADHDDRIDAAGRMTCIPGCGLTDYGLQATGYGLRSESSAFSRTGNAVTSAGCAALGLTGWSLR